MGQATVASGRLSPIEVSLITTLKDEAGSIRSFLDGLFGQSRLPEEIVIVDGGSTDGTIAEIERARASAPVPIRLIEAPGANISEGRNVAIAEASNEVIAVTDAGTRPEPDWLEKLVAPFEREPDTAVSSGFFMPGGTGWRQRTLAIAITPQREEIDPDAFLPSSRSVAFQRIWWSRVGGYPEWLRHCEDLVFDIELRKAERPSPLFPTRLSFGMPARTSARLPVSTSTMREATVMQTSGRSGTCFAIQLMRWVFSSCPAVATQDWPGALYLPAGSATRRSFSDVCSGSPIRESLRAAPRFRIPSRSRHYRRHREDGRLRGWHMGASDALMTATMGARAID